MCARRMRWRRRLRTHTHSVAAPWQISDLRQRAALKNGPQQSRDATHIQLPGATNSLRREAGASSPSGLTTGVRGQLLGQLAYRRRPVGVPGEPARQGARDRRAAIENSSIERLSLAHLNAFTRCCPWQARLAPSAEDQSASLALSGLCLAGLSWPGKEREASRRRSSWPGN